MKVKQTQLLSQLYTNRYRVCWLSGDNGWWLEEGRIEVNGWLSESGFVVERYQGADSQLASYCGHQSLLSELFAVEYCYRGSVNAAFGESIKQVAERLSDDEFVLLITGKLDAKQRQSKWYRLLEQLPQLLVVPIWPLENHEMQFWLQQRLKKTGIILTPEAQQFLLMEYQGNPAALVQVVAKLSIFTGDQSTWELDDLRNFVVGDARFSSMDLVKAILSQNAAMVLDVINYFQQERLEIMVLFWGVIKEIRLLLTIRREVDRGAVLSTILKNNGVWFEHRDLVTACWNRFDRIELLGVLVAGQRLESVLKGAADGTFDWNELREWCLLLLHTLHSRTKAVVDLQR